MRFNELQRLVWINILQNKFKVLLTSVGIIVGAATIVMVIAVGRGGQMDVEDQFKNLNAGAIDIAYSSSATMDMEDMMQGDQMPSGGDGGGTPSGGGGGGGGTPSGGGGGGGNFQMSGNSDQVTLTEDDVEDIALFVPGIDAISISFSTDSTVTGGELEEETSYTVAGVKNSYQQISNLEMMIGDFITDTDDEDKNKVCVLGYDLAIEIFGNVIDAYDSTIYIDERPYTVSGILTQMGSVSSGISPDESIFVPYNTAIKYITGSDYTPTITVVASDVNDIETVEENITTLLAESYSDATFSLTDAGSKMEAAQSSSDTLTMLLAVMATIVFIVGGIGIMNVLFVSVKERTKEIGILKAIGCSQKDILLEFLLEATVISILGGIVGVILSFVVIPIVEAFGVRVEPSAAGALLAVAFAIFTGTIFGFYPALKASKLVPVEALNED